MLSKRFLRLVSFLTAVFVVFTCLSGCGQKSDELELQYYQRAKEYIDKGDKEGAAKIIDAALEKFDDSELILSLKDEIGEIGTISGPKIMPNIMYYSYDEVVEELGRLGIEYEIDSEIDFETVTGEYVCYFEPEEGTELKDGEKAEIYFQVEPETFSYSETVPSRITAIDGSYTYPTELFPAHFGAESNFTEMPYIENGYMYLKMRYIASNQFGWGDIATVKINGQTFGAQVLADSYTSYSHEDYYFTVVVPVSSFSVPPSYFTVSISVRSPSNTHNNLFTFTLIW